MRRTHRKNKTNSRVRLRRGIVIVLCCMVCVVGSSVWQIWRLNAQVSERLDSLNQEKAKLLQEEKMLQEEIVLLNTPNYIEKLAREQLGLVKRGEILISPKN